MQLINWWLRISQYVVRCIVFETKERKASVKYCNRKLNKQKSKIKKKHLLCGLLSEITLTKQVKLKLTLSLNGIPHETVLQTKTRASTCHQIFT